MSKDLNKAFAESNLLLAWKWINSNTESLYKNYFRTLYKAFALSFEDNIKNLRSELSKGIYEPEFSIKVMLPKKSGILRPFTLLSIKDQIVYQAMMNVVADRLSPKMRSGYFKNSFGHIYAGRTSDFFYKKWTKGYKAFNSEITKSFDNGHNFTATFDLTACYDSIDHSVIRHFLNDLKLDQEFSDLLIRCLGKWTAHDPHNIFLGHGIPQGPLSSGMLSEVILKEFDNKSNYDGLEVNCFRYVDDIRLMAKEEHQLRKALVKLDRISKNIGLFPQTNKINIHEITNIDIEVKYISVADMDPEILIDQDKVQERLKELTKNNEIKDETKFKYVLAHAEPTSLINQKLLKLIDKYPHLYNSILNYFGKYKKFPKTVSFKILDLLLLSKDLYEELTAYYLRISFNKIHDSIKGEVVAECEAIWKNSAKIESRNLKLIAFIWILNNRLIKYAELEKTISNQDWWLIQGVIEYIDIDLYGKPTYSQLINKLLKHENFEVAINSAYHAITNHVDVTERIIDINASAQIPLKALGAIGKSITKSDFITKCLIFIADSKLDDRINWKKVIDDPKYLKYCENQIFQAKAYKQTDPTALVNSLDVLNDILIHYLFKNTSTLGTSEIGKIGSVLNAPTGGFASTYPNFYRLCQHIHELRLESDLSHPKIKSTQKPTRRIRFKEIKDMKKQLRDGYKEYINSMKNL